jgi:hypothetical protein
MAKLGTVEEGDRVEERETRLEERFLEVGEMDAESYHLDGCAHCEQRPECRSCATFQALQQGGQRHA